MSTDNEKLNSKDLTSKIEKENSICDKICNVGTFICYFLLIFLLIFLLLDLFYYIGFIIYDETGSTKLAEGVGIIFAACISVFGVLIGYIFNKRQTYKEIVTRERIEWLHKMQEALAEFLALTSKNDLLNRDKDKLDKARELYYLIISNLNVKEDKEKKIKNEREAVELLYKYANSRGLDVELNFNRNLDSEEKKDSNDTKSIDELRKEIISKYTEIFNGTWNRIKKEAD